MSQTKAQLVDGFNINTSVPADSLVIDSSGNVGIGTTTVQSRLHVKSNAANYTGGLFLESSANDSGTLLWHDGAKTVLESSYILSGSYTPIAFHTGNSERARIDTSGRLLVGTSSGAGKFIVQDSSLPKIQSNFNGQKHLEMGVGGTGCGFSMTTGHFFTINHQPYADRGTDNNLTERMRIGSSGGIDVSATGNGDNHLRATASQTTVNAANVYIDAANGALRRSTSSIKYKTDVETLQDSFADEILKCRPVWYRSTSNYDNQQWGYWGFIAEEVAEIDPRLCFYGENKDGSLEPNGVQYDRFVPHLLNLIKRQKEQIEAMEARLTALESA